MKRLFRVGTTHIHYIHPNVSWRISRNILDILALLPGSNNTLILLPGSNTLLLLPGSNTLLLLPGSNTLLYL
jgi:hypothetical protein